MVIEVFQIFNSIGIPDMRALRRSTRCHGISRRRFLRSLDKLESRIFTLFGLRRIAASDVINLSRRHFINLQFSIGKPSKVEKAQ
jgi:hypothetical protein